MRIVAMTNDAQLPMMKNMLNSAQKSGWPMGLFHCYLLQSQPTAATYNTNEFQSITIRKLEVILHNMRQDKEVLWIDNDIHLFQNTIENMRGFSGHYVMQDDLWGPCTGFFLVRSSPLSIQAIQQTIDYLRLRPNTGLNDQHAFVKVYKRIFGLLVSLLPREEYPNGEVYFEKRQTEKARMVHNNYLMTTAEKVERFKSSNLWDESDSGFLLTNRYAI